MDRPYQFITVERFGTTIGVRLVDQKINDAGLDQLGAELARLLDEEGCRNLILNLGPKDPECLYSIFLAKLVQLKKRLETSGGILALAHLSEHTFKVFQVTGLAKFFPAYPDQAAALKVLDSL